MKEYDINKGIGRPAEFKGLTSQYLILFAAGLLADFLLFVIMYTIGIPQTVCIITCVVLALLVVWISFTMNNRFGPHGLMKRFALKRHPRYILNRKSIKKLVNHPYHLDHEKCNESGLLSR